LVIISDKLSFLQINAALEAAFFGSRRININKFSLGCGAYACEWINTVSQFVLFIVEVSNQHTGPPQEEKIKVIPIKGKLNWESIAKKEVC